MAPFDECSVLIPAATLEDFPADATDSDARSMLAAWTVLWHPKLLAETQQIPTWYRADSPPEPDGPRIVVVPDSSFDQLPSGFEGKCQRNKECQWITGSTRDEMLAALQLEPLAELTTEHRTISVEDFYAAAYASLQIQIMTRRLRYTSNLDEINLQKQVVAAAEAFLQSDAEATAAALHNVFDCLAEERDHYFSSDPHLIDLTLLTPSTLDKLVESNCLRPEPTDPDSQNTGRLQTPQNILIDAEVAECLKQSQDGKYDSLRAMLVEGSVGWIGGAPPDGTCMDAMSFAEAEAVMESSCQLATTAIGKPPTVYGRFTGATPADLTPTLVRLGYIGLIPIDFARGTGHGDEAKVIQQSGGAEIQSLTAKPIDATSDAAFLGIGARLGEAIDSGEIATGLLAHWPDQGCDSFNDLRRVGSWCLALGRFWKLDDYFREGEHPYHHSTARAVSANSADRLTEQVLINVPNPISSLAATVQASSQREFAERLVAMTSLVAGQPAPGNSKMDIPSLAADFARASGAEPSNDGSQNPGAIFVVNPSGVGRRESVSLSGNVPNSADHIYGVSTCGDKTDVSVDVPASGFAIVQNGTARQRAGLLSKFFGVKNIADGNSLKNEFMEVSISESTGGIQGVYSGGTRGNRFSLRFVLVDPADDPKENQSSMKCTKLRVLKSTEAVGVIEVTGNVLDAQQKSVADFTVKYELQRGSRIVVVTGELQSSVNFSSDPWKSYLGARVAVASESAISRVMVRDKLHRARSRRLVAPLGVVIDEAERHTMIGAAGLAYHRRVDDRFVDTLLVVKGETKESFELHYGFDVPNPIPSAKSIACGPAHVPIVASTKLPPQGWITHIAPPEAMINDMQIVRRNDGLLAATVRVIQTRSKSANLSLRFCRDVVFATNLEAMDDAEINQELPVSDGSAESANEADADDASSAAIRWKEDTVRFTVSGHQVTDVLVVFAK